MQQDCHFEVVPIGAPVIADIQSARSASPRLTLDPVSRRVANVANDDAELILPVARAARPGAVCPDALDARAT